MKPIEPERSSEAGECRNDAAHGRSSRSLDAGQGTDVGFESVNGPMFERETVLERLGGDDTLLRDLVRFFDEDSPALLLEMHVALDANDVVRLARAAHALKGLVANFSANLAAAVAHFETIRDLAGLAAAREAMERLDRDIGRLRAALVAQCEPKIDDAS